MASDHTNKYQLNQWKKSDKVLMEDFNDDNQKIENALAGLAESKAEQSELDTLSNMVASLPEIPRIAVGTYTGTGSYGADHPTSVTFPFKPKLAVLSGDGATAVLPEGRTRGLATVSDSTVYFVTKWDDTTLSWYASGGARASYSLSVNASYQMNASNTVYHYFIIG